MRIGIEATSWTNPRGYGRYTRGLLRAVLEEPSEHEFILFIDDHVQNDERWLLPDNAKCVVAETKQSMTSAASASGRRSLRDLAAMARVVSRTPLDVFYFPSVFTYFPIFTKAKVLVGIHDVIAEDYPHLVFPLRKRRYLWNFKSWLARRQADYIVAVSEYSKAGIQRRFGWQPELIWVVGEAPAAVFKPIDDREGIAHSLAMHGLDPDARYIIALGGLNPHKNLGMLFSVFAELKKDIRFAELRLVLVGPAESDIFTPGIGDARENVSKLNLQSSVHFTDFIPDSEVVNLLNAAQVLVMPSLAEGFGLGAVEAAACGTPVIATNNSPLPQLLVGGGLFIDPFKSQELLAALVELLDDDNRRNQMGKAALARAQKLTWQKAALEFFSLLNKIEDSNQE
ncbi:MAG: glycosyltransferase family 4 protein [Chloroflexi bacterium]|nr:glycosyltransferase family 4 protein [Chloroflexota bacterium]